MEQKTKATIGRRHVAGIALALVLAPLLLWSLFGGKGEQVRHRKLDADTAEALSVRQATEEIVSSLTKRPKHPIHTASGAPPGQSAWLQAFFAYLVGKKYEVRDVLAVGSDLVRVGYAWSEKGEERYMPIIWKKEKNGAWHPLACGDEGIVRANLTRGGDAAAGRRPE